MKKLVLSTLLFFLALSSFSQEDSFYDDGKQWLTAFYTFHGKDTATLIGKVYFTFKIDGDSVINGKTYKKMINIINYRSGETLVGYYPTFFVRIEDGKHLFYKPYINGFGNTVSDTYFIGDDFVFFDEKIRVGDIMKTYDGERIAYIGDTLFEDSFDKKRKLWKYLYSENMSSRYREAINCIAWVEGIGSLSQPIPYHINAVDCACYHMLLYCIESTGDTIYRNQKYIDLLEPYFPTDISSPLLSMDISFAQTDGGCKINLPSVTDWSATLYNSNGVTVAQQQGNGSEIFLPTDSKGTHILVVKAGDKVVKKKVLLR